jgi:hypothetical protein
MPAPIGVLDGSGGNPPALAAHAVMPKASPTHKTAIVRGGFNRRL